MATMQQSLSSKERTLFQQVVKGYENKQYKKGLKAAEQILRKHPSHGDTQAMKALILNSQDQKDEAFALAKEALRNGMKSHITWHVYGLLYRSIKNWEEAARAYKMALRLEPDSIQIQRDLGLLQMQVRDYEGYAQSRRNILQGRSMVRQNWTALAIAQHLGGDLESAERTLNTYEETLKQQPPKTDIEHSEAVLYKITIIAEMAQTERALEHLDAVLNRLGDRTAALEMRARFLSDLGRREEAEAAYRVLLERNADYRMYYDGLMKAVDPEGTDIQKRKEICDEYVRRNPRGDAARRIPLDFLEGDAFREAADSYLQHMLKKGVPSTFANVKALYRDPSKMKTIIDLVEGYTKVVENEPEANGVKEESHDDDSNLTNGVEEKPSSSKSSTFRSSIHYFLIQHYNYVSSRDLTKAMHLVDKEIEAKPDSVDLHMSKARVYKHLGNIQKASETMELARTKDTRDRYINTKAAKYLLRNDQNDVAKDILSKFTKNDAIGGTIGDLIDLQCMWFLLEDGESHFRQGQLGLALKRFTSVYDVFEIWQEDQFDFHNFSLRKGQIRAYVDMIRWEDHLRDHPFFSRGARGAIRAYLRLHDHPELAHGPQTNGMNGELSKADKKKAQKKAAKAAQKAEQEEAEKQDAKKTNQTTADGEVKKVDTDPNGMKLVQTEKPLEDAMKFLNLLLDFSPKNIDSHLLGFEVFMRRRKFLLALRCLLASHDLEPTHAEVHFQTIRFAKTMSDLSTDIDAKVKEVLDAEFSSISPSEKDLGKHNETFVSKHSQNVPHLHAGAKARAFLSGSQDTLFQDVLESLKVSSISLESTEAGLRILEESNVALGDIDRYKASARERWPEASAFQEKQSSSSNS